VITFHVEERAQWQHDLLTDGIVELIAVGREIRREGASDGVVWSDVCSTGKNVSRVDQTEGFNARLDRRIGRNGEGLEIVGVGWWRVIQGME
jgi:hypothetical protein